MAGELRHPERCWRIGNGCLEINALEVLLDEGFMSMTCAERGAAVDAMLATVPPRRRRRRISPLTLHELAARYGCGEGATVTVACPCGASGMVTRGPCVRVAGLHVDHVRPISRGGTDDLDNLQFLCPRCNLSKHAKWGGK